MCNSLRPIFADLFIIRLLISLGFGFQAIDVGIQIFKLRFKIFLLVGGFTLGVCFLHIGCNLIELCFILLDFSQIIRFIRTIGCGSHIRTSLVDIVFDLQSSNLSGRRIHNRIVSLPVRCGGFGSRTGICHFRADGIQFHFDSRPSCHQYFFFGRVVDGLYLFIELSRDTVHEVSKLGYPVRIFVQGQYTLRHGRSVTVKLIFDTLNHFVCIGLGFRVCLDFFGHFLSLIQQIRNIGSNSVQFGIDGRQQRHILCLFTFFQYVRDKVFLCLKRRRQTVFFCL